MHGWKHNLHNDMEACCRYLYCCCMQTNRQQWYRHMHNACTHTWVFFGMYTELFGYCLASDMNMQTTFMHVFTYTHTCGQLGVPSSFAITLASEIYTGKQSVCMYLHNTHKHTHTHMWAVWMCRALRRLPQKVQRQHLSFFRQRFYANFPPRRRQPQTRVGKIQNGGRDALGRRVSIDWRAGGGKYG